MGEASMPNVLRSRPQSSTELAGRAALVGYSAVLIGTTSGTRSPRAANVSNIATAKSYHVVAPLLATW